MYTLERALDTLGSLPVPQRCAFVRSPRFKYYFKSKGRDLTCWPRTDYWLWPRGTLELTAFAGTKQPWYWRAAATY